MNARSESEIDKVMKPEQFDRILDSILDGKYSWACVLILRYAGYNPAHYIPYRTYYRLMKEKRMAEKMKVAESAVNANTSHLQSQSRTPAKQSLRSKIADLSYMEHATEAISVKGGISNILWTDMEFNCGSQADYPFNWRA